MSIVISKSGWDEVMRPESAGGRKAKYAVAVVHHNALLREGLCRILEDDVFHVVWQGKDGVDIVPRMADHGSDLILLEWEAPGVDESLVYTLTAQVAEARLVIVTRPDTGDDLTSVLGAGAVGCLSVNLEPSDFLAALRLVAQGDILVSHEMVASVTGEPERAEARLTPRELEVLRALGHGATNQEIADHLFISPHTVKIHVRRVLAKMDFRNRQEAAAYAASRGLL